MDKQAPQIKTVDNVSPQSVTPGQTAIISIGPGFTRLREHIELQGGLTLDDIEGVSLWADGQVLRELGSGNDIDLRNQYNKLPAFADNNILTIAHTREGLRRFVETHATGVGMGPKGPNGKSIQRLELKLDISSDAPATSAIKSSAEVTLESHPGVVLKETVHTKEYASNGEQVVVDLIQEPEQIDCIFLEEEDLTIDSLEVRNGGEMIFNRSAALNNHIIESGGFKAPQIGFFAFDKSERGFGKEPLLVTQNSRFELRPTVSGITTTGKIHFRKLSLINKG